MNGRAAKGFRRDLRRAVGAEALEVVDAHTTSLHLTQANLDALHLWVQKLDAEQLDMARQLGVCHKQSDEHIRMGFWQRLHWLMTGR